MALEELRELTHGINPPLLVERGLPAALDELCRRAALPTHLHLELDRRLPIRSRPPPTSWPRRRSTNAAKHSHASEVRVAASCAGATLTVEVADDGIGGAGTGGGSGLRGLADRVEALGGRFTVSSPPGRGTTLRAEIPCGVRVALADDAVLLREGLARLLTEAGFEVVGLAGDGDELLELVERTRPDVAIVDIRMPPTHTDEGLRAAKVIRERWPAVGILVLSQHVNARYALELLSTGTDGVGYLLKERVSDLDELTSSVNRVGHGGSVLDPAVVGEFVGRRRRGDNPLEQSDRPRAGGAGADGRGALQPGDRRASVRHRPHGGEARQEHLRLPVPAPVARRSPPRAGGHHVPQRAVAAVSSGAWVTDPERADGHIVSMTGNAGSSSRHARRYSATPMSPVNRV